MATPTASPFQSTLPARRATARVLSQSCLPRYFNPRSPHGERLFDAFQRRVSITISIHAPRTGSDGVMCNPSIFCSFQSTLPARGATKRGRPRKDSKAYFNPRSPHGERQGRLQAEPCVLISIHAPRTGSDGVAR